MWSQVPWKRQVDQLRRSTGGVASVEYTVLLVALALAAAAAIYAIGPALVERYHLMQALIGLPLP